MKYNKIYPIIVKKTLFKYFILIDFASKAEKNYRQFFDQINYVL